jgi:hypothetical protein
MNRQDNSPRVKKWDYSPSMVHNLRIDLSAQASQPSLLG